nr:zinc finger, C2H2 [Tanacetum cinerariifolium]
MEEVVKSEPCPSKASSISAEGESLKNKTRDSKVLVEDSYDSELNRRVIYRSSSRVFLDLNLSNEEDKKLKPNLCNTSRVASDLEGESSSQASESTKKETQEKSKVFSSRVFLDLNLLNAEDKKLEPNLYNTSRVASDLNGASSSQPRESTKEATQEKSKVFSCNYCKRDFSTSQALGGIGAGLQQDGHPIVYLSKALALKHQTLSTYEKKFLAIIITTPAQMKALPKLKGFDYKVKYKKGVDNVAADALSRVYNEEQLMTTIIVTIPNELFTRITASFLQLLQSGKLGKKHYTWTNGQLLRKNKLVVGKDEELRMDLWIIFIIVQRKLWSVLGLYTKTEEATGVGNVGVAAGFMTVILVSFVGVMLMKIMKAKTSDEMEMKLEEGSKDLDTVWIGYSKMPCATVTRADPNLENAGHTA